MANFNFNKVILGGRLTSDPELKTTPSGVYVTTFSLAVNRRFGGKEGEEKVTDFINVTAWRQSAEFITRYFKKGSSLCVVGTIQTRTWTDGSGNKRYATEVVADESHFVDAKADMAGASQGTYSTPQAAPRSQESTYPLAYVPDAYRADAAPQYTAPQMPLPQGTPNPPSVVPGVGAGYSAQYASQSAPRFEDITDDDDLPF